MTLAKASWLIVVGICCVSAVLLWISDYHGYGVVVFAVGLAAAVNLLPRT